VAPTARPGALTGIWSQAIRLAGRPRTRRRGRESPPRVSRGLG